VFLGPIISLLLGALEAVGEDERGRGMQWHRLGPYEKSLRVQVHNIGNLKVKTFLHRYVHHPLPSKLHAQILTTT
jgi:hypothetical protein